MEHGANASGSERADQPARERGARGLHGCALLAAICAGLALSVGGEDALAQRGAATGDDGRPVLTASLDRLGLPDGTASLRSSRAARLRPNLLHGLGPNVRATVTASFGLAVTQVQSVAACGELFSQLGSDGVDRLRRTLYYPATAEVVAGRCERGVLAATNPGSSITWLCPGIAFETPRQTALVLIHEALHFAGLPERPQVPGALSSAEINTMVHRACRL